MAISARVSTGRREVFPPSHFVRDLDAETPVDEAFACAISSKGTIAASDRRAADGARTDEKSSARTPLRSAHVALEGRQV